VKLVPGSSFGVCDFALSWRIANGHADDVTLDGLCVVMAGTYRDDEPGKPWRVILYADDRSDDQQFAALTDIFLGRAGGTVFTNFAARIGAVYAIRRASIELDHTRRHWFMRADSWVEVRASQVVPSELPVTCGIPGHDRPGDELVAELLRVSDPPLQYELRGRCGFESDFDYSSQPASLPA
jgi:hypothetical protein